MDSKSEQLTSVSTDITANKQEDISKNNEDILPKFLEKVFLSIRRICLIS